jgi:hypothetical protein
MEWSGTDFLEKAAEAADSGIVRSPVEWNATILIPTSVVSAGI